MKTLNKMAKQIIRSKIGNYDHLKIQNIYLMKEITDKVDDRK